MNAENFSNLLRRLEACHAARIWAEGKDFQTVYDNCYRGDWLLWLFSETNPDDLQLLTLVKGHCAATVKHLMKDERSIKAVEAAILYGGGNITWEELNDAASAAYIATDAAYIATDAAYIAAADAAYTAANTDYSYVPAEYSATAAFMAAQVFEQSTEARAKNQKETADIFRKFIPIEKINLEGK
jgi:hypothetical protein